MKLFDSLSLQKNDIKNQGEFTMYVCGITPYDTTHLGHAFVYAQFDALSRYLRHKGLEVKYTQNVTDIDDDLLKRAREESRNYQELAEFWTNRFVSDLKILNIQMPSQHIKASEVIEEIIIMIKKLLEDTYAYISGGNVYFDISKVSDYGKLSKYKEEEMKVLLQERGGNINDSNKKNPLDFILWQKSLPDEPSWNTPFGPGRPGWHIECSAVIHKTLGKQIDLHGGGGDLIFPHHESEIAQSESFSGVKPFVRTWMHIGMLRYKGEKMSKSLKNLVLISELIKRYSPLAIRWMLLSHHYQEEWEYTDGEIVKAEKDSQALRDIIMKNLSVKSSEFEDADISELEEIIDDNLNFPRLLVKISQLIEEEGNSKENIHKVLKIAEILGFTQLCLSQENS